MTGIDINNLTCFKSIIVACATLHFYYTVTHFNEEVEYIWSRKWTVGKIMYLLTRYLGTIYLICCVIGVNAYIWNDDPIGVELERPTLRNLLPTCLHGELFAGLGPMIILAAEVILQMRVYALYGRDKRLLAFFILLTITLFGFNILQMSLLFLRIQEGLCRPSGTCFTRRSMSRGFFIPDFLLHRYSCPESVSISGIGWTVTAFTELLLFLLVFIKARKRLFKRQDQVMSHDICASMAKDSLSYFVVLFTVCLFGAIIAFVPDRVVSHGNDFTAVVSYHENSYVTIAITIMTILAPRLIINLREEFYGPSEASAPELSWNADAFGHFSSNGGVAELNDADTGISEPERA